MGVCAVGAWLVRRMWLGMLAIKMLYKTTITNALLFVGRAARRPVGLEGQFCTP